VGLYSVRSFGMLGSGFMASVLLAAACGFMSVKEYFITKGSVSFTFT